MKKGTYFKVIAGLMAWAMASTGMAESAWQGESLTYSPDRWPSRWSAIVRQNQPAETQAYGYGSRPRQSQQDNPWAHDSSVLFEVPAGRRPWGEPPRKTRRQQERSTYSRDQRQPAYRGNTNALNKQYPYPGIAPQAYPGLGYLPPLGYPGGAGLAPYGYGVSPLLGSPLLTPPLLGGYPYGAYPGLGGMNWPFGAW